MSNNKLGDPLAEEEVINEETQIATAQAEEINASTLSVPKTAYNDFEGDFGEDDLPTQYMSIVSRTSDLAETFGKGSIVLNKEVKLGDGKTPFPITVLSGSRHWEEYVPFGEGATPQTFATMREAAAAGFSSHYEAKNRVGPVLTAKVLVPVPSDFAQDSYEGQGYAVATWIMQKTAYKASAAHFTLARTKGHLKDGLWNGGWDLSTLLKTGGNGSWYVPVVTKLGRHDEKFAKWIEETFLV